MIPRGADGLAVCPLIPAWLLNLKIADRLTFWFLAISIVPCSGLALAPYRLSETSIEYTVHPTLPVTAKQKAAQMESSPTERTTTQSPGAHTPSLISAVA